MEKRSKRIDDELIKIVQIEQKLNVKQHIVEENLTELCINEWDEIWEELRCMRCLQAGFKKLFQMHLTRFAAWKS